jgi:hypothetical protein
MNLRPLRRLPATLVSPEHVGELEAVAGQFASAGGILIECPLGDAAPTADLSVSFSRPASTGDIRLVSSGWPAGAAWERVHRFVDVWREPAGPLWNDVRSLWLEFDLRRREATASMPVPNVFFGRDAGLPSRATILAGFDLLLDADADARRLAAAALDTLPPGALVLYPGVMLARRPAPIRVCVDGPPWQDAPADLIRLARHAIVQVEAGTDRVGFELYQGRRQRGRAEAWRPLLDRLVEAGAARAGRCAAALEWPGYAYDHAAGGVVARWINHVKLTCDAGTLIEAKVYLQFATPWAPAASDAGGPID